jgi:4-diphosphocytidyl-2-C-methyl-D-erythritol kinase
MLLFPHAKINLGLSVLEKHSDGFHSIESGLYPIKIFDILEIVESDKDELFSSGALLESKLEDNLVWKALQLMRKFYTFPSLKIHLHKQIPSGAGLGGGSSDAAHTLLGVDQLFRLNITKSALAELASKIGSDCPFFLNAKAQYAIGKGEVLESLEIKLNNLKLVVVIPDFSVSTKIAYSKIIPKTPKVSPKEALQKSIEKWKEDLKNDFETSVFCEFPLLSDLKEMLYQSGAIYVSLSGSGSGMYALFSDKITLELPKNYTSFWLDV